MSKVLFAALAVLTFAFVSPVCAQDVPAKEASEKEEATPVEAAEEATSTDGVDGDEAEEISDESATESELILEDDLALFWGKRREVKVIQKRLFEKDGRLELAVFSGIIPNDDFIVYFPTGLRAGYHFSEAWQVEGSFAYTFNTDTELATFLIEEAQINLRRADVQEIVSFYYNLDILWAPIYGKISLLGTKLTHFEIFVGLGAGLFHTTEYPESNPNGNAVRKFSGNTILGFRWFINDVFNIRTEYRQFFFQKYKKGGGGLSIPVELSLGFGVTI